MPVTLSTASLEYVRVPVSATVNGAAVDPTSDTVKFAFKSDGTTPVSGDFVAGSWETAVTGTVTTYLARCLVGPSGTTTLAAGTYQIWVKVTDNPEVPIRAVDWLTIQ